MVEDSVRTTTNPLRSDDRRGLLIKFTHSRSMIFLLFQVLLVLEARIIKLIKKNSFVEIDGNLFFEIIDNKPLILVSTNSLIDSQLLQVQFYMVFWASACLQTVKSWFKQNVNKY